MSMPIQKFGVKAVGAGAGNITITFATDEEAVSGAQFPAGYTVSVVGVPDWATSVRITAISVTAVTFTFGTSAPAGSAGGGQLFWQAMGR